MSSLKITLKPETKLSHWTSVTAYKSVILNEKFKQKKT